MSNKEKILEELSGLSPDELLKVRTVIGELKKERTRRNRSSGKPYLRVRNALKNLKSSLTQEVILERSERL